MKQAEIICWWHLYSLEHLSLSLTLFTCSICMQLFLKLKDTSPGSNHHRFQLWKWAEWVNGMSLKFHWGPFFSGPLFQVSSLISPNPEWQRWDRSPLHKQTGWAGGCCGLLWGARLCQLGPSLFYRARHLPRVLSLDKISISGLWSLGLSLGAFPCSLLFYQKFSKDKTLVSSNLVSKKLSVHVQTSSISMCQSHHHKYHIWFQICSGLIQLYAQL